MEEYSNSPSNPRPHLPVRPTMCSRVAISSNRTYRMCLRILNRRHNAVLADLSVWPPKMYHCWLSSMDHIWHCPHRMWPTDQWPMSLACIILQRHKAIAVGAFSCIRILLKKKITNEMISFFVSKKKNSGFFA